MKWLCNQISRWMALIVLIVAVCSLLWPDIFGHIKVSWINWMLGCVMFGMGMTLRLDDFKIVFTRPKDIIIGCLAQFTIMPLIAWLLTVLFRLPADLAVGVILVGCCPGGTASNVITYLAKGDLALSVGMTAVSTLLAPLLTPALTWLLAGTYADVDTLSMLLSIVEVVILPIIAGLVLRRFIPRIVDHVSIYLPAFSSICIALIVAAIVAANSSKLISCGAIVIAVVILHNIMGYALGYSIGWLLRLTHPKRTAICIEVGMQNSGLACSLATQHFAALTMTTVPGAVFSVWHNISGAILAKVFRAKKNHQ